MGVVLYVRYNVWHSGGDYEKIVDRCEPKSKQQTRCRRIGIFVLEDWVDLEPQISRAPGNSGLRWFQRMKQVVTLLSESRSWQNER